MDIMAEMLIAVTMLLAVCMALAGMRHSSSAQRYREAMEDYQAREWPRAYETLAALADSGDAPAARVAALMARQGPELFGQRFDVSPERLARWERTMRGRENAPTVSFDARQVAMAGRAVVAIEQAPLITGTPERAALQH